LRKSWVRCLPIEMSWKNLLSLFVLTTAYARTLSQVKLPLIVWCSGLSFNPDIHALCSIG
ncbi:MAG: hypothetical protein AAF280_08870, partial [Pseudomonadota bacterium]